MAFQLLINPSVPCMKYCMPWLVPIDVTWWTHNTSKQFAATHVKFSKTICINFAVPSCKTNHRYNHSITKFQARCHWNHCVTEHPFVSMEWTGRTLQSVVHIVLPSACICRGQHTAQPFIGWRLVQHCNRQCLRWLSWSCHNLCFCSVEVETDLPEWSHQFICNASPSQLWQCMFVCCHHPSQPSIKQLNLQRGQKLRIVCVVGIDMLQTQGSYAIFIEEWFPMFEGPLAKIFVLFLHFSMSTSNVHNDGFLSNPMGNMLSFHTLNTIAFSSAMI